MSRNLALNLDVVDCPACGGDHPLVHFEPGVGPSEGQTHQAVCPVTGRPFWMDTHKNLGVWEALLHAAGVTHA